MINKLQQAIQRLQFYLKAANSKGHGTHSPFVFLFITEVLNDDRKFYAYEEIKSLQDELRNDKRKINYNGKDTSIATIAESILPEKCNQLLFRMVSFYKPIYIVEVGGSLGITTAYLAAPNKTNQVYAVETNTQMAMIARQTLKQLHLDNATIITAEDYSIDTLKEDKIKYGLILVNISSGDLYEVYTSLYNLIDEETIVVLTGINKNLNNKKAWGKIKEQVTITMSIELFNMGLIFFRKEVIKKQHFKVRF